jgi:hypothetical protein
MGILAWLILGIIAGFIARKVVNKAGEGLVIDLCSALSAQSSAAGSCRSSAKPA